jgi:adenylyl-sulfate kinase
MNPEEITTRAERLGQQPLVVWFTGLSGSGKSTLASALESRLMNEGLHTFVLDGDQLRAGLNSDLGFDPSSRVENIRRAGEVCALMADAGLIVLAAFISPYQKDRERVRNTVGSHRFLEVFVDCPVKVCAERDVKGLYRAALQGELKDLTGVQAPYEVPESADLVLPTGTLGIDGCLKLLMDTVLPAVRR